WRHCRWRCANATALRLRYPNTWIALSCKPFCALPCDGQYCVFSLFRGVTMANWFNKTAMIDADKALPGRSQALVIKDRHWVTGRNLLPPFPPGTVEVQFGLGCFWGAERLFWQIPGVYTTAVGYAGGYTPNPTYEEVCSGQTGHTEVVLVVYDPSQVTFSTLLQTFWQAHDPTQ